VWHDGRDLPPCRSTAGSWRRAALLPEVLSCRRGDLTLWGTTPNVYFSKFLIRRFFENHDKIKILKNSECSDTLHISKFFCGSHIFAKKEERKM
jgi:hypothetical protein